MLTGLLKLMVAEHSVHALFGFNTDASLSTYAQGIESNKI